ncbi:MAG: ImmA/IrrE family metallo-endopeptidase [archaeon]
MGRIVELNNMEFRISPVRLKYLLDLYKLSNEEFLSKLQGTNKNIVLSLDDISQILQDNKKVKLTLLKKMDNIFGKGVNWLISKRGLPSKEKFSLFFRKDKFNSRINIGSIRIVEEFERKKDEIEAYCNNINYKAIKKLNYNLTDDPDFVAKIIRKKFDETRIKLKKEALLRENNSDRDFLENLIRIIEEFNVFVFEFTENWNKKDKADFNGFFMSPNLIVIKRQQNYFKREIFTLMHEFAHYLINEEEIDEEVGESLNQGKVENWCNEFAYQFLIADFDNKIKELDEAVSSNGFHKELLEEISKKTRLSTLALYTKLRIINKISAMSYSKIYDEIIDSINKEIQKKKEAAELERQILKEKDQKSFTSSPKPIESNLFKEILKINYFEGNISEGQVLESLKLKNKSINEVIYS